MNDSLQNGLGLLAKQQISNSSFRLVVGGDVQAEAGTYIHRSVDDDLLNLCLRGKFSYVLACRQIGKSSLKNAVAEQLTRRGWRVVRLDLNRIGQDVKKAEDWYFSLLDEIARRLALEFELERWWEQYPHTTWARRFLHFFDSVVLQQIADPIVIFIDEIDMTLGLPYTDDLFAAIRSIHNDRAQNSAYHRLTFILLGVATPDQLVNAPKRTPFNIGHEIAMRDFLRIECTPLLDLLNECCPGQGSFYFDQVFGWTNGHPYLTQKLCQALVNKKSAATVSVDELVKEIFLSEEKQTELNLAFVHNHVLNDQHVRRMLDIYQQILHQKTIKDDQKSPVINRLKLYGLVVSNHGVLQVRNRIYEQVFDEQWCRENYPRNWRRIAAFTLIGFLSIILVFAGIMLWHDTRFIPDRAEKAELSCYRAATSVDWMTCLTSLFTLDEQYWLFTTTAHTERALGFFFDMSSAKQLQLFDTEATAVYSSTTNLEQVYTVIDNVKPYLADTRLLEEGNLNHTDALLQAMAETMAGMRKKFILANPMKYKFLSLQSELQFWSVARRLVRQTNLTAAEREYDQAIKINTSNSAILFERAVLRTEAGDYEAALRDLEHVISLIGQLPLIPNEPTPTSTTTPTLIPTATVNILRPDGLSTYNPSVAPAFQPTPVSTIAATATPVPIVIERVTRRKLRDAVAELFAQYPALQTQAASAGTAFPSLIEFGFVSTEVAVALTVTPTVSPTSLTTVTASATPNPTQTVPTPTTPAATATSPNPATATFTPVPPTPTATLVSPKPATATATTALPTATNTPVPTPNLVATQTTNAGDIATAIAATLTALATVPPTAIATPLLIATPTREVTPTATPALPTPTTDPPTATPQPPTATPMSTPSATLPLTPSSPTPLPSATASNTVAAAALPPLSGRIAFSRLNNSSNQIDTYIYCIDTQNICMQLANMRQPNFSADGRLVANGEGGGREDIIRMNANYGEQELISRHPEDAFPHVAPNGEAIVYSSRATGRPLIYTQSSTQRPDNPAPLKFTSVELVGTHPVYLWGNQIAYQGCDYWRGGADCGIYIVSDLITAQAGEPGRITTSTDDLPTDNLAGQVLFMANRDGNWDVYLGNRDNRLTTDPAIDGLATASPDGTYIAFLTNREGVWSVYVMNNDGTGQQKLFDLGGSYGNGDKDWRQERLSWGP